MDRFETNAIADAEGVVHVRVGAPGAHVRVAVTQATDVRTFTEVLGRVYGSCAEVDLRRPDQLPPDVRDPL